MSRMRPEAQSFVQSLAQALNSAQVPCVVWGNCLDSLQGVPALINSCDFVIPNDCLEAGTVALATCDDLVPCPDPESCFIIDEKRISPPPASHAHFGYALEDTVGLYLQSETLWFLPPMDASLLLPNKVDLPPYFALASDETVFPPRRRPGRGCGVFPSTAPAVIAPKPHILLEAYMRLFARDHGKWVGLIGVRTMCNMSSYVDADGFLDADLLPEPLRTSYKRWKDPEIRVRQWSQELNAALGLPPVTEEDFEY
ncbi:thioredoxin reductase [Coniochaeta ligniaria NRRL 30616]|uniref:Thioredoxin reductase n=1 Tax=Coniochaeta ligniaria NRRL 30616 TaxID=1408157 RepID=A0A1J7JBZ1_9PEZI|nr:thioredoxin reductase [Coniochaeta ligniaria NRRL 30616]